MNLDEIQIQSVVEQVVRRLVAEREAPAVITPPARYEDKGDDGLFDDLEEAIAAASEAQRALEAMSLEQRRDLIAAIRRESMAHSKGIAQKTVEETGMGKVPHKIRKLEVVVQHTPGVEDLQPTAWTGDNGLTVVEMAPFGVIAAVTPSTHPVPTMVNNAISFIAAGNSAVFAPHPSAKDVSALGLQMLNRAIVGAGGPPNLLVAVREPSIETAQSLFVHPDIDLVLVTGGGGVVKAAMQAPKRVIAAGPGNPPVVVDETADIEKAALGIIEGGGFDNNILCIGEKEVFAVQSVADELMRHLKANNCVELDRSQIDALTKIAFPRDEKGDWMLNRDLVGRSAYVLAAQIGLNISPDTELLIGEVENEHDFVQHEQMMPFVPLVRTPDVHRAIDWAIRAEQGYRHTAVMHSKNVENMTVMARQCKCTIFVKNGASSAGLGAGGEGYTSFSIATPTGEGCTSARTFTRQRRCALIDYFRIV